MLVRVSLSVRSLTTVHLLQPLCNTARPRSNRAPPYNRAGRLDTGRAAKGEQVNAYELKNGNLLVPFRAEAPDGTIGDGAIEVKPGTKEYEQWKPFAVPYTGPTELPRQQ